MADPKIVTSVSTVQVPEGGQVTFNVKLSSRPSDRRVEVKVKRISGDESIRVSSGEELKFSRRDYRRWKTVTLTAPETVIRPTARPRSGYMANMSAPPP